MNQANSEESWYDVFLGGTCATSTWRQDTVIPLLKYLDIMVVVLGYFVSKLNKQAKFNDLMFIQGTSDFIFQSTSY